MTMKKILLFGAGKSATVLIQYLLEQCQLHNWYLTVVDAQLELAEKKIGKHPSARPLSFDINNAAERAAEVKAADLVISLLPPSLHLLVAKDCIAAGKNLLTASYIDSAMEALRPEIEKKGLLFLCEMGLDPGIDHMSAKQMMDGIKAKGGVIRSFLSHCGGLVAKEYDNNPWHYKISWNPRNVVHAGKTGATFRQNGTIVQLDYNQLFANQRPVAVQQETYCWYPNRDSLSYIALYGLENCDSFIRTTLRHPDFIFGWQHIIELGLTDTEPRYETDGMSLKAFFQQYFREHDFDSWLQDKLEANLERQEALFQQFQHLQSTTGNATTISQQQVSAAIAENLRQSGLLLDQLSWLGVNDRDTIINRGLCSAADVLQFALETKLPLEPGDRDLVVMQHEITYQLEGKTCLMTGSLVLEGINEEQTAMAATVGLPLGIAAVLVLNGSLDLSGLHIPIIPEIYQPVLKALEQRGIGFKEETKTLD